MADWIGVDVAKATTCGHEPHKAKGLCKKCYMAQWRAANPAAVTRHKRSYYAAHADLVRQRAREWQQANTERAAERTRAWIAANPEQAREMRRRYYRENQAHIREYRRANAERIAAAQKARRLANPEGHRNDQNRRRARKLGAGAGLTAAEWLSILVEFGYSCAYCSRVDLPLQQEHMTPLSRGGEHSASNVVPSCAPCNLSKHTRTALEFMGPEWSPHGEAR